VRRFDAYSEREYFAIRTTAGLQDYSPLTKYDLVGPDAKRLASRVTARDVTRLGTGRIAYTVMCSEYGWVVDDGTVQVLGDQHVRLTMAEHWLHWLHEHATGFDVAIRDVSRELAILSLQGPAARRILDPLCAFALDKMRFFRVRQTTVAGAACTVGRTGYTGDLGFEITVDANAAGGVWDAIMEEGRPHQVEPIGLDALDVARIEAGYMLQGCDYHSARSVLTDARKSTPDELAMAWAVDLDDREVPFVGQRAIRAERAAKRQRWALVGLVYDVPYLERLYDSYGMPPHFAPEACRDAVPMYQGKEQVGQATSHTWSPVLKQRIALASVRPSLARPGTKLHAEYTVDFDRRRVPVTVVDKTFFSPERKTSTPGRA
jgi:aminomethyltransferase